MLELGWAAGAMNVITSEWSCVLRKATDAGTKTEMKQHRNVCTLHQQFWATPLESPRHVNKVKPIGVRQKGR